MNGAVRFRWFTALVVTAAFAAAAIVIAQGARVDLVIVVLFGVLLVIAEHQDVELNDSTSLSAGSMFAVAGIAATADRGFSAVLAGLCIGAFAGIEIHQLRAREYTKVAFNGAAYALATAAAGVVIELFTPIDRSALVLITAGLLAGGVFITVNLVLVVGSISVETGEMPPRLFVDFLPQAWHMLPFAVLGAALGQLYGSFGATVVVLFFAPIFIARATFASFQELRAQQEATVRTLIGALEAKDRYTAGHAARVAQYAQYVGQEMRFTPGRLERLRFAALMHDVGKLVVPNHLLNKPGRLTEEEFEQVKQHESVSVEILTRIDFLAPVAPAASGDAMHYRPDADDAPIEPFIVAVADAYDAMTSSRSYRRALAQDEAFEELRRGAGTQFHPLVVDALITAIERRGERHGAGFEQDVIHVDAPIAGTGSAGLGHLERSGEQEPSA